MRSKVKKFYDDADTCDLKRDELFTFSSEFLANCIHLKGVVLSCKVKKTTINFDSCDSRLFL